MQLKEKKRARSIYGVLERQFYSYYEEASRKSGVTGEHLLQFLERRLDNVVYRLGFAESRAQARQAIRHRHMTVNDRRVDIPSFRIKEGDVIGWTERARNTELYKIIVADLRRKPLPKWLSLDAEAVTGKVEALPEPSEMDVKVDDRMIVEFYAR